MPTIQDLQNLAAGNTVPFTGVAGTTQTVIVTNQNQTNGGCLPCDDVAPCEVRATQAVAFDNGSITLNSAAKNRYDVVVGAEARHLTFLSNLGQLDVPDYPRLATIITPNGFSGGVTVNGLANATPIAETNKILAGGAIVAQILVNYDNTLPANAGLNNLLITQFHIPVGIRNSVITITEYTPFCDFCVTTNNSARTTHAYTANFVTSFRDGFDIFAPALSVFTFELCYSMINLPNTLAATALNQWA